MPEEKYYLEIESDPNNLLIVEEFVNYFSSDLNVDADRKQNLLVAVSEACTNAIIHANKKDINKIVTITAKVENNDLVIIVKDQGEGFDHTKVPDPTEPENLLKDSGRGLYLMRAYLDDLKFNVTPTGTETILILHL